MIDSADNTTEKPNRFKQNIATALSFLVPGFGQYYNGELRKAIVYFIAGIIILLIGTSFQVVDSYVGFAICVGPSLGIRLLSAWEARRSFAKKSNVHANYKKPWLYLIVVIVFGSFVFFTHPFLSIRIGIYDVPTTGNFPTVHPHDYIVADFNYYERNEIDYGHMVVFKQKGMLWMFRIVGMPGDVVELRSNFLFVNGDSCETLYLNDTTYFETYQIPSFSGKVREEKVEYRMAEYMETLPNGYQHSLVLNYSDTMFTNKKVEYKVPPDHYFLLGDNRHGAMDSRFIGPVHKDKIRARITKCLWGLTPGRFNIDLTKE